jgi:hypothetical protein
MKNAFFKHFTSAIIKNTNHKPHDMAYYVHGILYYRIYIKNRHKRKNMYIFNKLTLVIMLVGFCDKKLLPPGKRNKKEGEKRRLRTFRSARIALNPLMICLYKIEGCFEGNSVRLQY